MKLTKAQSKLHEKALALVHSDKSLTFDEKLFVFENYQEAQGQLNSLAGAFFTPYGLARDFSIEVHGRRIVDLCAGIGMLSFACHRPGAEIVCVERCAAYVEVGRRLVPEAQWIEADVFALDYAQFGRFDCAISNPPFGAINAEFEGKYTGGQFEYRVIEQASRIADYGVFILPQQSAPFRLSGQQSYHEVESDKARKFREQTGIEMRPNCGIDTSIYRGEWKGVSPVCEIVCCEFDAPKAVVVAAVEAAQPQTLDLFAELEAA